MRRRLLGALFQAALAGAECGDDCWCLGDEACRAEVTYTDEQSQAFKDISCSDTWALDCDPFTNSSCASTKNGVSTPAPADDAVCAVIYTESGDCSSYTLQTYDTQALADEAGATLTHSGGCGVCSTLQDLHVYLKASNLVAESLLCGAGVGAISHGAAVACFEVLGFTTACAHVWAYDMTCDLTSCGDTCLKSENREPPYNVEPDCHLNPCLQCDEDQCGPVFQRVAGRTRRSTGLKSEIVRNCSEISDISHTPCSTAARNASAVALAATPAFRARGTPGARQKPTSLQPEHR